MNIRKLKIEAKQNFRKYYWSSVLAGILLKLFGAISVTSMSSSKPGDISFLKEVFLSQDYSDILEFISGGAFIFAVIAILLSVFVVNIISVGGDYFHLKCRKTDAENVSCGDVFWGFRGEHYGNVVKTMFLKNLFIFLWSLLLIIPGIIKAFQYALVGYIISENPQISSKEALAKSQMMMKGYKWKLFALYLSFILWSILSILTFGMLGIFWVNPYKYHTHAAFYEAIKNNMQAAENV